MEHQQGKWDPKHYTEMAETVLKENKREGGEGMVEPSGMRK